MEPSPGVTSWFVTTQTHASARFSGRLRDQEIIFIPQNYFIRRGGASNQTWQNHDGASRGGGDEAEPDSGAGIEVGSEGVAGIGAGPEGGAGPGPELSPGHRRRGPFQVRHIG